MGDLTRAEAILRAACGDRLRTAFPMAPLTTFRIGGPAALFLEPETDADLEAASHAIIEGGLAYAVVGKGSNVLVSDRGFDGLVLRLGRGYRWSARDGDLITAGGSMPLPALAGVALRHGLDGLAFGVAIPASLGGAVKMNAGAHGAQMSDVLAEIEVFRLLAGTVLRAAAGSGFAYRHSGLAADEVVIGATVRLRHDDPATILASMAEARAWRRRTQPLAEPNCGSVFRNPPDEHSARVIEEAGLKGARVGGAEVSRKHANFIIAGPGASADDVWRLIELIRREVSSSTGIILEPEVQMIGEFDHVSR